MNDILGHVRSYTEQLLALLGVLLPVLASDAMVETIIQVLSLRRSENCCYKILKILLE